MPEKRPYNPNNVINSKRVRVSTFEETIKSYLEKIKFLINNNNIFKKIIN